jgi:hypothetical protein
MDGEATQFKTRQEVLDVLFVARAAQEAAWKAWFAVRDCRSDQFEAERIAYVEANAEVNQLIAIDNAFIAASARPLTSNGLAPVTAR